MPDYPNDYYYGNDPSTPPPVDPCPDGTCCPPPVGPGSGGSGGSSGGSGSSGGGGCGGGRCFGASSSNPIRYATGILELVVNDLYSPGFGESWGHTRTYGNRFFQNGVLDSYDGVNGWNWVISTDPHLVEMTSGSDEGAIAVMGNVNATLWFDFAGSAPNEYVNRFNGPETLEHDQIAHLFRLTAEDGSVTEFHDFDQFSYPQGLFKRQVSPGGQVTEVVSYYGGEIGEIQRSATVDSITVTESLAYSYGWYGRLDEVILQRMNGSGLWSNRQRVIFTYWSTYTGYWSEPDRGSGGDLRSAETFEWDGFAWKHTGTTYYTYYRSAGPHGFVFGLQHVLGPDAVARMVADGEAEFGYFTDNYGGFAWSTLRVPATADLAAYADNTFEYDSQQRVTRETVQGGTLSYQYAYTTSSHPEAPANWKTKTTETFSDGTQLIIYSNADGQTLLSVNHTASGDWIEYAEYTEGYRTLKAHPSAVISYDELEPDLGVVLRSDDGLIELFEYSAPTDPIPNKLLAERIQQGSAGTPIMLREYEYTSHTAQGATVYPISQETVYKNDNGTGAIETAYAYLWHAGTNRVQQRTVTLPAVPVEQNGSGISAIRTEQFDLYGNLIWTRDERGVIMGQKIDPVLGVVVQRIDDVNTSLETDAPTGWTTVPGFGLNLITDFAYDAFGRQTRELGPEHTIDVNGVATLIRQARWTVYLDDASGQEVRTGQGYLKIADSSQTLINPVMIRKETPQGKLLEDIQALQGWSSGSSGSASPEVPVSVPGPVSPEENEFPQESFVRWTTYQYANCCQLISNRRYHTIPASGTGTEGTNYDQTRFDYDTMGRRNRTQSPGGTITFTVFDARSLPEETWIGTNDDGATEADPSGGGFDPDNNMVIVTTNTYDNGQAGGDGNLTQQTQHVNATETRVTAFGYDWRNRQIVIDGEIDFFQQESYDNLSRVIKSERYNTTVLGNLIARSETKYDPSGRVYESVRYGVDPSTGAVGTALTDKTWYDAAGHTIKSLPAGSDLFTKITYDSLGRSTASYIGYDADETSYADAFSVSDDVILEQSETTYDAASNVLQTLDKQRYHNAPDTQLGALGDPATAPKARVTYQAVWSDELGRTMATADYGTNGGTSLTRPSMVPARSDLVLVTTTTYNAAGEVESTTDPAAMETRNEYDAVGRQTTVIQNYQSSSSSSSSSGTGCSGSDDVNVTVVTAYNADGNVSSLTAVNSATGNQVTQYVYGTTLANSEIASSLLKRAEIYPDSTGGSDQITFAYNRQQQVTEVTDQGGTVHAYDYDKLSRQTQDRVTNLGSGVDGAVRRIATAYEVRGMRETVTSYDDSAVGTGSIVNQVQFAYNDFRQLTADYQSHSGAVNVSTTTKVLYGYADGSTNTVRQTALTYPNGRELTYFCGSSGSIADRASRVASIVDDDDTHLVDYEYLGRATFVVADDAEPEIKWTLVDQSGGDDPDTGDIYSGFDRFGQVKDNHWYDYDSSTDVDRIKYGYDRVGNRIWRENVVARSLSKEFDEIYSYDGIHRLKDMQRGTLNTGHTALTSETFAQCWTLDSTGNWQGFRQDDDGNGTWDLVQSRTANAVNEITDIANSVGSAWIDPAYSPAGNMTTMPQPNDPAQAYTAVYDAWNRLVKITDGEEIISEYIYDGAKRRIVQLSYVDGVLDEARQLYYTQSSQWQVVEERLNSSSNAERQFVWGLRYIDDCVLRDRDANANGTLDQRLYAMQDSNWNVTGLSDNTGSIQERYAYSAYGVPVWLSADFAPRSAIFDWESLYSGYRYETRTGLFHIRNRVYQCSLGMWVRRDPIGYFDSDNLYFVNAALNLTDPTGLMTGQQCIADCQDGCYDMYPSWWQSGYYLTCITGCESLCYPDVTRGWDAGYGSFCGPTANRSASVIGCCQGAPGGPGGDPPPHDALDRACWAHDCCLGTVLEFITRQEPCNLPLCLAALDPRTCNDSPTPVQCRQYQTAILLSPFCVPDLNITDLYL